MTHLPSRRQLLGLAAAAATASISSAAFGAASPIATRAAAGATPLRLSPRRLEQALRRMVTSGRAAGVSAVVWQDGAERWFGAFGQADREARRPMARDTMVRLWSMTKPVASVALMRQWDAGRFRLDDPLGQYLPEFKAMRVLADDGRGERPAERPILVRDILRHTSGLTYGMLDGPADRAFRAAAPFETSRDLAAFSRAVAALPLRHEPGTAWHYGTSTDIVARLVEVLADEPFDVHVRERLLRPLGMRDTDWTLPDARRDRMAATYGAEAGGALKREADIDFAFASGGAGLIGPIDDYLRFARMLLGEGALGDTRVLRPATVRLMMADHLDPALTERHFHRSPGLGFGLGGSVRIAPPAADEPAGAVGEFSWGGMASTLFWVDPANRLAVVFFAQKVPFDEALHRELRRAVYG
ncbi:serine hydrolase [Mitsuaria sp. GD03876]|uniref:serine hydrolase domain-containing protein n=1 Tax=Mitsuaria sp. GD03876 TaxID=2975399 RepID=UPI00244BFC55|nr:serine hydrolase [Mitsuaria sp. GD03876]MDH0863365.1 beta-lactamase family protein [Mitsuaria sp. GD03876]